MVYVAPVGSKHESESLFQNLATNFVEVQTLGGIILLEGDFNARIAALLDTIDTNDLGELLQASKLVETDQPSSVANQQNRDANVGGWGRNDALPSPLLEPKLGPKKSNNGIVWNLVHVLNFQH